MRDKHERKHRRTTAHPECVETMANADFTKVQPLSEAMGLDVPPDQEFIEWTCKIRVARTWVEDGFDLTADRLHDMVTNDLQFAYSHEIETEILSGPSEQEIMRIQAAE